jgi:hypothetical protein
MIWFLLVFGGTGDNRILGGTTAQEKFYSGAFPALEDQSRWSMRTNA